MELLMALAGGLLIGAVLGLLGGGGALMAIPVLIYVFHYSFRLAVGSGLALVTVGVLPSLVMYCKNRQVDWFSAMLMGGAGIAGASIASRYSSLIAQELLLGLLVVLMGLSAWNMFQGNIHAEKKADGFQTPRRWALLVAGFGIGVLTGLVGVGGGFLLVPVLLILGKLNTRSAIATSLVIIGLNALAGTLGYLSLLPISQPTFLWLILGSLVGSLLGYQISLKLSERRLKQGFGLFLVVLIFLLLIFPPS